MKASFQKIASKLKGQPAWQMTRTHGSMFFLEIGAPRPLKEKTEVVHGEWHFLIQMAHWRLETADCLIIGSDDEQGAIDKSFQSINLKNVVKTTISMPSYDLRVDFSTGISLKLFSSASAEAEGSTEWSLYCPDGTVWVNQTGGKFSLQDGLTGEHLLTSFDPSTNS